MSNQFKLPELGEGVHEGELIKWQVKVGDSVKFDQPLCEIMTDKATIEIPSAFQGKVSELHFKEGSIVHVGERMLTFEGSALGGASAAHAPHVETAAVPAPVLTKATAVAPSTGDLHVATRVLAAPSTRRVARELGVELANLSGTGPHGRVMREDLAKGIEARPVLASAGDRRVPLRGLRKKIAEKMRQSKDHAAHFTYVEECDMSNLVALRNQAKVVGAQQGVKVTYLPFIMKAMVAALKQYPILNSSLDEEKQEIVYKGDVHIALSVQTEDGLTAPVIKNVAQKSILELAKDIQEMGERARNKKLTLEDFSGGTITLTNAGTIGGLFATPVINYPEVAILGFNKIFRKPVVKVVDGKETIAIADWTYFSISLDHRVVDGAIGAEFMKLLIHNLENPALLLLMA
ncbi:dihydrolipoamide acetyltransferase family protein [Bdellovibrionota bacterium FG-1]